MEAATYRCLDSPFLPRAISFRSTFCFTYELWAWNNQAVSNVSDPHSEVFYFSTDKALMILEHTVGVPSK